MERPGADGELPEKKDSAPKKLDLTVEWQRQSQNFLKLGFHVETGYEDTDEGKQAYLETLPKFKPQPKSFKGRFDFPLLVETKISTDRQYELAGFKDFLKGFVLDIQNWPNDPKNYKTPENPYTTWVNDPAINRNKKVTDVRETLAEDERGGTRFDGIALYIANPKKLEEIFIDLPGDLVGSDGAPGLSISQGKPILYCYWLGIAESGWGSLTCGREIEKPAMAV